ncbi:MAG: DUF5011 domain-containing protein [Bacteroidales bacterium]|nr:DUF5011 domain-containing protein [Bacteroidales bacterium]
MKNYISIFIVAALAIVLVSCEKLSADVTRITYYPTITLEGDAVILPLGSEFKEPGYSAEMNGEDITSKVTVSALVDNTKVGVYSVTYSAVNEDGITASVSRPVYVVNPGHVDNCYLSHCYMGARDYEGFVIVITEYQQGIYLIDDLCGGFYCYGRYPGYEPTYDFHADTYFSLNADGSIRVLQANPWYFLSSFDYTKIVGGYNSTTGSFSYNFDGLNVELTPLG